MLEDIVADYFPALKNTIYMDYEGQKLAEYVMQIIITVFAAIGFMFGYYYDNFGVTMIVFGAGVALALLITLPPWPMFRSHPLKWRTPKTDTTSIKSPKERKGKSKGRK